MKKTKKFPVSIGFGDYKTKANEFLVPNPFNEVSLIGIKTGKQYLYGAISYIGLEISPEDIIDKMKQNGLSINDEEKYSSILSQYIDEIKKLKISNVIEIVSNEDGNVVLRKVANRPQRETF